jgi:hypothetical protein
MLEYIDVFRNRVFLTYGLVTAAATRRGVLSLHRRVGLCLYEPARIHGEGIRLHIRRERDRFVLSYQVNRTCSGDTA